MTEITQVNISLVVLICTCLIHAVGSCTSVYSIYSIYCVFYHHRPRLRPKPSQSQPCLTALAWPADLKSLSRQKPGQSRGFQAKPGRNITKYSPVEPKKVIPCHLR